MHMKHSLADAESTIIIFVTKLPSIQFIKIIVVNDKAPNFMLTNS